MTAAVRRLWHAGRSSRLGETVRTSTALTRSERPRFIWAEMSRRRETRTWELRRRRGAVTLRSGTRDTGILREVFVDVAYRPPPQVEEVLSARGELRVVDLGANIGLFSLWARSRWPQARIHGFEPDPANLVLLERNLASAGASWSLTRACAAPFAGEVLFADGLYADSHVVFGADAPPEATKVPAVDVFPHLADADLLKMDIEGGEWPLLTDPRFAALALSAVVLEYHAYNCPDPAEPARAARELLEACGYLVHEAPRRSQEVGTMWGWKPPRAAPC